jgi:hypothetical protein
MPLTKIQSLGITDGTIVNADINASAAIAGTKISGSFGKVLQVVSGTDSTSRSTTSTSFVTTNLSVSITPSLATSKILVLISQNGVYKDGTGNGTDIEFRRDATVLGRIAENAGGENSGSYSIGTGAVTSYLDSPNTTSAITYETFFRRTGADGAAYVQVYGCLSMITCLEIAG